MAEYVTDVATAMDLAQGPWAKLLPEAIDTKDQTQRTVDNAVETMTSASAQAKADIINRLSVTAQLFGDLPNRLETLRATGRSADAMRTACRDLSGNVERLETALNEAFEDLDREITELGAEVSDIVAQFGAQFQAAGDLVEDGRTKWVEYVSTVQDVHDTMITY